MLSFNATLIDIALAFVAAALMARLLIAVIHRKVGALDVATAESRAALHARARHLTRTLMLLAFGAAALVTVSLLLEQFGVRGPLGTAREIGDWLRTSGVRVAFIVVGAMVVIRAAHLAIEHLQHRLGRRRAQTDFEWQRRASTLAGILSRLVTVTVTFMAALMLLGQFKLDVAPILTGAGIAGLAVGFGAQNLVRDVISGFFIILEDQLRIGDSARINGVSGAIEQISLRTVVLRDVEGAVHVFPNGTIASLANLSKQFAYAVVDLRVSYREDIDLVLRALHDVGNEMLRDPDWTAHVLEAIDIGGVESLTDRFAVVRVRFKTPPLKQGAVANELRRRIMKAFAGKGIRPFG